MSFWQMVGTQLLCNYASSLPTFLIKSYLHDFMSGEAFSSDPGPVSGVEIVLVAHVQVWRAERHEA